MSFSQQFFKNAEVLLNRPDPRQVDRMLYAQRFFSGLQLVLRVATLDGYARELDYDQITEEELMWLSTEVHMIPNSDSDVDLTSRTFLRDQVARSLFEYTLTEEKIIMLPGLRQTENYF